MDVVMNKIWIAEIVRQDGLPGREYRRFGSEAEARGYVPEGDAWVERIVCEGEVSFVGPRCPSRPGYYAGDTEAHILGKRW